MNELEEAKAVLEAYMEASKTSMSVGVKRAMMTALKVIENQIESDKREMNECSAKTMTAEQKP